MEYITKSGKVLTDEDIEKLADEAEAGYSWVNVDGQGKWIANEPAQLDPPMSERPVLYPPDTISVTCPHCGSNDDIDHGATGFNLCKDCGGLNRGGKPLSRET